MLVMSPVALRPQESALSRLYPWEVRLPPQLAPSLLAMIVFLINTGL